MTTAHEAPVQKKKRKKNCSLSCNDWRPRICLLARLPSLQYSQRLTTRLLSCLWATPLSRVSLTRRLAQKQSANAQCRLEFHQPKRELRLYQKHHPPAAGSVVMAGPCLPRSWLRPASLPVSAPALSDPFLCKEWTMVGSNVMDDWRRYHWTVRGLKLHWTSS